MAIERHFAGLHIHPLTREVLEQRDIIIGIVRAISYDGQTVVGKYLFDDRWMFSHPSLFNDVPAGACVQVTEVNQQLHLLRWDRAGDKPIFDHPPVEAPYPKLKYIGLDAVIELVVMVEAQRTCRTHQSEGCSYQKPRRLELRNAVSYTQNLIIAPAVMCGPCYDASQQFRDGNVNIDGRLLPPEVPVPYWDPASL